MDETTARTDIWRNEAVIYTHIQPYSTTCTMYNVHPTVNHTILCNLCEIVERVQNAGVHCFGPFAIDEKMYMDMNQRKHP